MLAEAYHLLQLPKSANNNTGDKDTGIFASELIKPLSKAPLQFIGHNEGRKIKTAVLTDTPGKNALAKEQATKKKKKESDKEGKGKRKRKT